MESLYDYGSRAGFWRLHRLFQRKKIPCTVFAVGMALERNPEVCGALKESGWEVASHGYRWWDYQDVDEITEREHIDRTVKIHERLLGKRPVGMYQGKVRFVCGACSLVSALTRNNKRASCSLAQCQHAQVGSGRGRFLVRL